MINIEQRFFIPDERNEKLRRSLRSNVLDFEIEFGGFLDAAAEIAVSYLNRQVIEPDEVMFWTCVYILSRIGYGEHDTEELYDKFIESLREQSCRAFRLGNGKEWDFHYDNHGVLRASLRVK